MDDDELIAVLEDAGLSPYQAEAYVTLLSLGNAAATDVADACEVPDPRIYDVLRDLESKGYVETYQQDSLSARAHDPQNVLADLRERSAAYETAAEVIEHRWEQPAVAEHEVSIVKRLETVLKRAKELIRDADFQVCVAVDPDVFTELRDALAVAHDDGASVKVCLCTDPDDGPPPVDRFEGVCSEVRHRPLPTAFLLVVDRHWTCFAPHEDSVNEYGVIVSDDAHTFVFHWFFMACLWETWETIFASETDRIASEYVNVRYCVRDLAPLVQDGATVTVSVEGRDTDSNDHVTVDGTVTDVTVAGQPVSPDDRLPLSTLAGRVGLVVDDGTDEYAVGGWGATVEDLEATRVKVLDVDPADAD